MRIWLPTQLALLLTITLPSLVGAATYSHYFKEVMPLVELEGQVAIFAPESADSVSSKTTAAHLSDSINRSGVPVAGLQPHPMRGWWTGQVTTATTGGGPMSIQDLITRSVLDQQSAFISPVFKGAYGGSVIVTPELLVRFEKEVSTATAEALLRAAGAGEIVEQNRGGVTGAYRLRVGHLRNAYAVLDVANHLAVLPEVRYAEPDMINTGHSAFIPTDPGFSNSWALHNLGQSGGVMDEDMDAVEAWDISRGSATVKILVIDTGVEQTHPDLNQLPGRDFTSDGPSGMGGPVNEFDKHGTPVAGCITARMNNGLGTTGIAPECLVLSARPFIGNSNGGWTGFNSHTADALSWARDQGARVSNNSNFYNNPSAAIDDMYAETYQTGMVHFASAGNNGTNIIGYPARAPFINSVASMDRTGARTSSSQYGPGLDFLAPGVSIYTTDRTGAPGYNSTDYVFINGTSFASPNTAGVAALILSHNPGLTSPQVEQYLQVSCVDKGPAGYDTDYGWGLVNAHRALLVQPSSAAKWELY